MGDFAQRTLANLQIIENSSQDNNKAYEVTQLVNSLLALIVFPKERHLAIRDKSKWEKYLSKYVIYPNKNIAYDNIMKTCVMQLAILIYFLKRTIKLCFKGGNEYGQNVNK